MNKQCKTCGTDKPLNCFYIMFANKDGYCNECKECYKARVRIYKKTEHARVVISRNMKQYRKTKNGKEVLRNIQTKYGKTSKGYATRCRYAQSEKGKISRKRRVAKYRVSEKSKRNLAEYNKNNPDKVKARNAVKIAKASNRIPRASELVCTDCEQMATSYHHHKGYDENNRLEVIPLCWSCHGKREHFLINAREG